MLYSENMEKSSPIATIGEPFFLRKTTRRSGILGEKKTGIINLYNQSPPQNATRIHTSLLSFYHIKPDVVYQNTT